MLLLTSVPMVHNIYLCSGSSFYFGSQAFFNAIYNIIYYGRENEEEKALDLTCAVSKLRCRLFPEGGGVQVSIPF